MGVPWLSDGGSDGGGLAIKSNESFMINWNKKTLFPPIFLSED